ncbi:MAG TPA: propionate catabolism operon regulatory protein PrpR, partial [Deltaproteobacteria bacterium]|nr:propionate catabolism operon regulatory protein PrpR [Deltaproteobacteria bacterium]
RSIIPEIFNDMPPQGDKENEASLLKSVSKATEAMHIERVVSECGGNHVEAAKRLGISRTTLWRRLNKTM